MSLNTPDLTKQPPRSPRVRLGGYASLPRMLDKGRATLAGKSGEYHFDCPLDKRLLSFLGLEAEQVSKQLAAGKSDGEILEWIQATAKPNRNDAEIVAWSASAEQRVPTDPGARTYFNDIHAKAGPKRSDIATWFDLLDLDDYVSFGGKA